MLKYLDFQNAKCKDCYKCLRECPVKAIEVTNNQAKIIEKRCILCGHCTQICPQNAKIVHTETEQVQKFLKSNKKVIATVAPAFVSSFGLQDFSIMAQALEKLGFIYSEETAVGAKVVTDEYERLLNEGSYKNFITSACPGVNRMIQLYYHNALKYLAPIDSPMIAHAKMLRKRFPDAIIVFIGPCIAKKKEASDSNIVDAVLTFDNLNELFKQKNIDLNSFEPIDENDVKNKARYYPISRGIIKSFPKYPSNYELVAVDGLSRVKEVLDNIETFSGMFLELNCCEYACVNGPCKLKNEGGSVKANESVRTFAHQCGTIPIQSVRDDIKFDKVHLPLKPTDYTPTETEIKDILAKIGKFDVSDELNCGACGYNSCREKAWAVANGYAKHDMCVPYMRERAESMSYEIIQNSPNGIILLDATFKLLEINKKAKEIWGIKENNLQGRDAFDFIDPIDFIMAAEKGKNIMSKKVFVEKTNKYIELTIVILKNHNVLFGVMKDITDETGAQNKLDLLKLQTLETTDQVIKKQMRVAQEIASLLGETTAETKVAILKLKKTLIENNEEK